ncbi:hypothetical protein [Cystobacter ferrugineus]|uniref:Lipoprotein n=1 Tax=Cystobacter ferrugineus TaxID=83449 RepID=A0A1L9BJ96_9BACT|nr:hypothetical protein [Cystobacter ferrugineus]OJH42285.1 hypothetical protein BON30_03505 [Cystobacter ferrugineus]
MRKIISGALWSAMVLAGCQTGGAVATRDTPVVLEQSARNPSSLERGLQLRGTVDQDYADMLVMEDEWGEKRYLRIGSQTRYYQSGKQVSRTFLAPGSTVRASFDDNNRETIAREIHIVGDIQVDAPVQLPTRSGAPIP